MKTILYVINTLGPGGAERQLVYLIEKLDREKYHPIVLTLYDEHLFPYYFKDDLDALNVPIHCLQLERDANPILRFFVAVWRYIRFMWRHRPQIVQGCLHFPNLIARAGRIFCPRHRLITMAQEGKYTPRRLQIERYTAFLTDVIVANSARSKIRLIEDGRVRHKRLMFVNCGVKYEQFTVNTNPDLRREMFPDVQFMMLMASRIAPNKDHATLLRALNRIKADLPPGFLLVLIGAVTYPETQQQVDQLIAEFELQPFIRQLPPTDDIAPYYHAADVMILPSSGESFGLVLVESFAAGTPVIASEEANVLGIVRDNDTGWVFPTGDDAALAQVLKQVFATSPAELAAIGERAALEAPQFNVEIMAEQFMKLYE